MKKTTRRSNNGGLRGLIALALVVALLQAGGAAATPAATQRAQATVERIESGLAQMRESSRPLQGFAAEGTRAVAHSQGTDIRKIEVEALGERGRRQYDFFWSQGRLVAARSRRIDLAAPAGEPAQGRPAVDTVVVDDQLWFERGALVGLRQLGQEEPVKGRAARELAQELQGLARSFERLMKQRQPSDTCLWSCARPGHNECLRYRCE